MAWVRIEDAVADHPKHLQAGPAASWLWLCGIAFCQRQLTDGFIPSAALPILGVAHGVKALVDRLVAARLFDVVDGGYRVHDYHDFNDTREAALARKALTQQQRRQAGLASGRARQRNANGAVNSSVERNMNSAVDGSLRVPLEKSERKTNPLPLKKDLRKEEDFFPPPPSNPVQCMDQEITAHSKISSPDPAREVQADAVGAFVAAWNTVTTPPIGRCREVTTGRRAKIRARLHEHPLPYWQDVFARVQGSAFCRGDSERGWKASMDWIIANAENGVKVLEGKYDAPPHVGRISARGLKNVRAIQAWIDGES